MFYWPLDRENSFVKTLLKRMSMLCSILYSAKQGLLVCMEEPQKRELIPSGPSNAVTVSPPSPDMPPKPEDVVHLGGL